MKKTVTKKNSYPVRHSSFENEPGEVENPEVTYVWTCFNGVKLFIPFIRSNYFPTKSFRRKNRGVRF
jgi:hypothetical protein